MSQNTTYLDCFALALPPPVLLEKIRTAPIFGEKKTKKIEKQTAEEEEKRIYSTTFQKKNKENISKIKIQVAFYYFSSLYIVVSIFSLHILLCLLIFLKDQCVKRFFSLALCSLKDVIYYLADRLCVVLCVCKLKW